MRKALSTVISGMMRLSICLLVYTIVAVRMSAKRKKPMRVTFLIITEFIPQKLTKIYVQEARPDDPVSSKE